MPSRRSYPRSHTGCQNCKTRRVKCDEHFPSCFRCQKRKETCSFTQVQADPSVSGSVSGSVRLTAQYSASLQKLQNLWHVDYLSEWIQYQPGRPSRPHLCEDAVSEDTSSTTPTSKAHSHGTEHTTPSTVTPSDDSASMKDIGSVESDSWNNPQELDALDQVLFNHYVSSTHRTFNEDERIIKLFGSLVPQIAPAYPFLMRSLLAASGSHCLSTVSTTDTALIAKENALMLEERTLHHQNEAIRLYSSQLTTVDLENASAEHCIALCMTCAFILLFSLDRVGGSQFAERPQDGVALDKAIELLRLQAGIAAIYRACGKQITSSELAFLLDYKPWSAYDHKPSEKTFEQVQLDKLESFCTLSSVSYHAHQSYMIAITNLRSVYYAVSEKPHAVGPRLGWLIDQDALDLASYIEARQPEALLILAHWGACLDPWPGAWWESGFAKALLNDIVRELPAKHVGYMDWILQR